MSQAAVVYWSGTGHTEAMAHAVAAAAQADLFTAAEFDADKAAHYAAIAFGCQSMGAEQLEESEFEPMFEAVKPALAGKKIALLGSYGWGGGECALDLLARGDRPQHPHRLRRAAVARLGGLHGGGGVCGLQLSVAHRRAAAVGRPHPGRAGGSAAVGGFHFSGEDHG